MSLRGGGVKESKCCPRRCLQEETLKSLDNALCLIHTANTCVYPCSRKSNQPNSSTEEQLLSQQACHFHYFTGEE